MTVEITRSPAGRAGGEPDAASVTGGEDHLRAAVLTRRPGAHGGHESVKGAAREAEALRQIGHLHVASPEEGVELGLLLRVQLVAVDRRAGLGFGQGAAIEIEDSGQGVELGIGGDAGAGLPGLDLALDDAAFLGHDLLTDHQLDPPVVERAGQTGPVAEPLEGLAVDRRLPVIAATRPPSLRLAPGGLGQHIDDPGPGRGRSGECRPDRAGLDQGSAASVAGAHEAVEDQVESRRWSPSSAPPGDMVAATSASKASTPSSVMPHNLRRR